MRNKNEIQTKIDVYETAIEKLEKFEEEFKNYNQITEYKNKIETLFWVIE